MFIHAHISAPKRFAKFGWQTQTLFVTKKSKKRLPNSSQTHYDMRLICVYLSYRILLIKGTVQVEVGKIFCRGGASNLPFYRTPQ